MSYRPGVCNIGWRNRLVRFVYGLVFFSAGVWLWAFIAVNSLHPASRVFLFIPFYLGFLGMYQGVLGFCVYHAHRKTFNMR